MEEEWEEEEICFSPPLSDDPIPSLAAVASLEPPSSPSPSCAPPTLPPFPSCKDPAFTGKLLPKKRKLVHMILFGFEVILNLYFFTNQDINIFLQICSVLYSWFDIQVDTLEIHLRETADFVDHYFLLEATLTHKGEDKPILWERLRCTQHKPRFLSLPFRFTERFGFC